MKIDLREKILENKILLIAFVLSTTFFLFQHYINLSWDFSAYVANAKYWLGQGQYYEILRPPLMPAMLAVMSIFTWPLAEYVFILLVSGIFLFSSISVAKTFSFNRELFYILSLSPFLLSYGLINGTELLSFALFEFFLVYLMKKDYRSGIFLGLAFMARYNLIIFLPLMLYIKQTKDIGKSVLLFVIPAAIWSAFNFITTGNLFTSVADSYALIFKFHESFAPVNPLHILSVTVFLLPFMLHGLYLARRRSSTDVILLIVLVLSLCQYFVNPIKDIRYIFLLTLPAVYFSMVSLERIRAWSRQNFIFIVMIIVLLNASYTLATAMNAEYEPQSKYANAIELARDLDINNCRSMSNAWPLMNYAGKITEPSPHDIMLASKVDEGYFAFMFYSVGEPGWIRNESFIGQFPVVHKDRDLVILGNASKCLPVRKADSTYMERMKEYVEFKRNITINTNPCFILFKNHDLPEKLCNLMNGNGFKIDENRYDAADLDEYLKNLRLG